MKKIYGNEKLCTNLVNMVKSGRTSHTVMFYGEKGSGKKLAADFYTQLLLCENLTGNEPCGVCRSCMNVEKGIHPDVYYVPTSGKLGGYSIDTARHVCADAFIKPNNSSGRKIYIFRDCYSVDQRTQNALLKLIEEPPDYAYFIFTTESKSRFLPTIISRCTCFGMNICTEAEAEMALAESGYNTSDIKSAVNCFHGNIGMCTDYILDENLRNTVSLTKSLTDSIVRKNEYELCRLLCSVGNDRIRVKSTLIQFNNLVRDAAILGRDINADVIGCSREQAERLLNVVTVGGAVKIHGIIEKTWKTIECNVSVPLAMTTMCAEIMQIIK